MTVADCARDAIDARHQAREIMTKVGTFTGEREQASVAKAQVWATLAVSYELAAQE